MSDKTPSQEQKDTIAMFEHMARFGGGPAAPLQIQYGTLENGSPAVWFAIGLTKREQLAAMMLSSEPLSGIREPDEVLANRAVHRADALLEKLKNTTSK
jgi:hypothetical protein